MNEKTKRIVVRRRIREVITVKQEQPKTFVCKHCGKEQTFKVFEPVNKNELTNGENKDENNDKTR